VQSAYDKKGDSIPAHVLVLARRICLACSQSQAEADWHQQACEEAAQREDKLRHQLTTLLDLVSERDLPPIPGEWDLIPDAAPAVLGPPQPGSPQPVVSLSLWERVLGALRWQLGSRQSEGAPSEISVAEMAPPRTSKAKRVAAQVPTVEIEKQKEPGPPSLVVYCLGQFRVYQDDQLITDWPSGKGKCIFKYMIANRGRPVPKEVLMDLFWRESDPDSARNNLNVAIYGLRQALRATRPDFSHIIFQDDHYLLNSSMALWVDAEEFVEHYEAGRKLENTGRASRAKKEYEVAEGLYQGDFLEEDLYEDWPMPRREGLKDNYLVILDRLSRYYLVAERYAACIHLCRRILAKDDCREDAHRRLMRCYSRQGQRNLALRQYHLCAETLAQVLDVFPMRETEALYSQIRQGEVV
jgi:DNA-binding SARP family transcriptional activator